MEGGLPPVSALDAVREHFEKTLDGTSAARGDIAPEFAEKYRGKVFKHFAESPAGEGLSGLHRAGPFLVEELENEPDYDAVKHHQDATPGAQSAVTSFLSSHPPARAALEEGSPLKDERCDGAIKDMLVAAGDAKEAAARGIDPHEYEYVVMDLARALGVVMPTPGASLADLVAALEARAKALVENPPPEGEVEARVRPLLAEVEALVAPVGAGLHRLTELAGRMGDDEGKLRRTTDAVRALMAKLAQWSHATWRNIEQGNVEAGRAAQKFIDEERAIATAATERAQTCAANCQAERAKAVEHLKLAREAMAKAQEWRDEEVQAERTAARAEGILEMVRPQVDRDSVEAEGAVPPLKVQEQKANAIMECAEVVQEEGLENLKTRARLLRLCHVLLAWLGQRACATTRTLLVPMCEEVVTSRADLEQHVMGEQVRAATRRTILRPDEAAHHEAEVRQVRERADAKRRVCEEVVAKAGSLHQMLRHALRADTLLPEHGLPADDHIAELFEAFAEMRARSAAGNVVEPVLKEALTVLQQLQSRRGATTRGSVGGAAAAAPPPPPHVAVPAAMKEALGDMESHSLSVVRVLMDLLALLVEGQPAGIEDIALAPYVQGATVEELMARVVPRVRAGGLRTLREVDYTGKTGVQRMLETVGHLKAVLGSAAVAPEGEFAAALESLENLVRAISELAVAGVPAEPAPAGATPPVVEAVQVSADGAGLLVAGGEIIAFPAVPVHM